MAENPVSELLKKTKAAGTDVAPESGAIKEKMQNINAYKEATSAAPAKPAPSAPAKPSPVDKVNPSGKYGTGKGEMTPAQMNEKFPDLPKMHTGGTVMHSGPHNLQKGEKVLTKEQHHKLTAAMGLATDALSHDGQSEEPQEPPKIVKEVHIRPAANGGFIAKHIHHMPHDMPMHDEEHVQPDMKGLHGHIDALWGDQPEGK